MTQNNDIEDRMAKTLADSIGHGMREKCEKHVKDLRADGFIHVSEIDGAKQAVISVMNSMSQTGDYDEPTVEDYADAIIEAIKQKVGQS